MIRQASSQDLAPLVEISARTFYDTFVNDNDPADLKAYLDTAFSTKQLRSELEDPNNTFYLAYADGETEPWGYAKLREGKPERSVMCEDAIEIERLYVDQRAIGQGVGAALMRTCLTEARARRRRTVWLGVWEHNHRALAFYGKWGFEVVGSHPFVVGEDEQIDLVMELSLDGAE